MILLMVLGFNLPLVIGSYIAGLKKEPPTHFFEERETVTFFSCMFMAGTALTSFVIAWLNTRLTRAHAVWNFWWLSGCGFIYLCLDDYFMGHEGIDRSVLKALGVDPERFQLDGVVIGVFGLIAFAVCAHFRKEIIRHPTFVFLVVVAGVCLAGTVLCDQLEPVLGHHLGVVIEESFKVTGACVLFTAYLTVLFDYLKRLVSTARS
jgi:hypothetical protein